MKKWFVLLLCLCMLLPVYGLAAETVTLMDVKDNGDCTATVNFINSIGSTTTIIWINEGYTGEASNMQADQVRNATSYTIYSMAPGERYTVIVMNDFDFDTLDATSVSLRVPSKYDDYNIRLYDANLTYFRPDSVQGDYGYNYASDFTASKIEDMLDDHTFMLKVDYRHPVFSNDFDLPALTVVKSPRGYISSYATEVTIYENCEGFWQTMIVLNSDFENMIEYDGGIHTGKYEVTIYLDGKLLATDSFTIR